MNAPAIAAALLCLALTGCTSAPPGTGLFSWWAARGERAAAKATTAYDQARERQLEAARLEAAKTTAAAAELQPSPEATLTQRFAGNTTDLLAQAVPSVTAEQLAAVRQLVVDLRSQDAKLVAAAEARQRTTETDNATLSRELGATAAKLDASEGKARTIAADNAKLAGELLAMRWAAAAGALGTVLAGGLYLAMKLNLGGLQTGVATAIASLRKQDEGTATLATAALDAGLNRAEQSAIAKRVQRLLALTS